MPNYTPAMFQVKKGALHSRFSWLHKHFSGNIEKQNIKQLIGQNAGVSNIELTNSNIKSFDRTARKYGIDYAVKKDRLSTPPKYLVFFKSRDADAMTAAFTEFSKRTLRKEKQKQSVKKTLEAFKKLIKEKGLDKVKELVKGERER